MGLFSVILIGVGLSMDAFAVSLSACLTWHGSRWLWHCRWLDSDWGEAFPAVVRASSA